MTSPAKLLLWLFVASSLYHLTSTASTTNDTEDILGENVNEMSYSDIKDVLENNKSDTDTDQSRNFEVLSESKIDEELKEEEREPDDLTEFYVFCAIFAAGPILFIITALLYCLALACEKRQEKSEKKSKRPSQEE